MSIMSQNIEIATYLNDVVEELDGAGLVITDIDAIQISLAKMADTGFPVLRGLLEPRSDVVSDSGDSDAVRKSTLAVLDEIANARSMFPEAQEPVKCSDCGWIGFESELETYPHPDHEKDGEVCPSCQSCDIGSTVPAANVEPAENSDA